MNALPVIFPFFTVALAIIGTRGNLPAVLVATIIMAVVSITHF